jgi:hypothetical protein
MPKKHFTMQNAIFLNNPWQVFLVRQAVVEKIKQLRDKGFSENSREIHSLKTALPELKELNGVPVEMEAQP